VLRTLEQEAGTWDYPVIRVYGLELSRTTSSSCGGGAVHHHEARVTSLDILADTIASCTGWHRICAIKFGQTGE